MQYFNASFTISVRLTNRTPSGWPIKWISAAQVRQNAIKLAIRSEDVEQQIRGRRKANEKWPRKIVYTSMRTICRMVTQMYLYLGLMHVLHEAHMDANHKGNSE